MNYSKNNPVRARLATCSTKMLNDILKQFNAKGGTAALTEEEFLIEGEVILELLERGFEKMVEKYMD